MDFQLSEEQLLIKQSISELLQEPIEDCYEFVKSLADMDLLGMFFPENFGGAGIDFTSFVMSVEEIAKTSASAALVYANHCCAAAYPIFQWGSEELIQQYLPQLIKGERIGAFALNEGTPVSDLFEIGTQVQKTDKGYVLNGTKKYIVNALPGTLQIVFARTSPEEISAFVVEGDSEGVSYSAPYGMMGLEGVTVADITFDQVFVPEANLLSQAGQGKKIAKDTLALKTIALSAIIVGLSQKALESSISYGKGRIQFGRPIISFEALQVMVGNMAAKIEASRLLTYKAASQFDGEENHSEIAQMALYMAKSSGEEACIDCIQIHGGYGYSKDLGVDQLFRDVKGISVFEQYDMPLVLSIAKSKIS